MEAPDQSQKKQNITATEPKPTKPKPTAPKLTEPKPTKPEAVPVSSGKLTLRKSLGVSKEEARKLAKHYMSMAAKLMEDSDEE